MHSKNRISNRVAPAGIGAALALAAAVAAPPAGADVVADWSALAASTINATGYPAVTPEEQRPTYMLDLATVHVALYDAVTAIAGGYQPFAATPATSAAGASIESAAGAATCRVLQGLFPNRSAVYATACTTFQPGSPGSAAQTQGVAVGVEVADAVLALRANDGRATAATYTSTGGPGNFVPFPSTPTPANVFLPYVKPFALTSAAQFRAYGPPALGSRVYTRDLRESTAVGGTVSAIRTPDQEELARYATEPPPAYWPRNLRRFANAERTVAENARLQALLWVGQADALTACFESKYVYAFWRPRTAIPQADTDGNPATRADAAWTPFLPTPNHPEYPAAHGCGAGAVAETLEYFFGTTAVSFDFDSTVTGTTRHYDSTDDFATDMQLARIYGGMHFRNSTIEGTRLGRAVAKWVTTRFMQPVAPPG